MRPISGTGPDDAAAALAGPLPPALVPAQLVRAPLSPTVPLPSSGYRSGANCSAIAHRGGAGLAVENSLAAFARSYALGIRYLETDARVTADGVCVAFHDSSLRRMVGLPGRVESLSWDQLRRVRLRGGAQVPRLDDVLAAFPDARFTVDLKDTRGIGALAVAVRRTHAQRRVCVAGCTDLVLADVRAVIAGVTTAMGWDSLTRLAAAARLGTRPRGVVRAPYAHVPLRLGRLPVFAERLVTMTHDLGAQVLVWTVNDPARMHRLLDCGVDGIMSDRPDLLREVLLARGHWTAPAT